MKKRERTKYEARKYCRRNVSDEAHGSMYVLPRTGAVVPSQVCLESHRFVLANTIAL